MKNMKYLNKLNFFYFFFITINFICLNKNDEKVFKKKRDNFSKFLEILNKNLKIESYLLKEKKEVVSEINEKLTVICEKEFFENLENFFNKEKEVFKKKDLFENDSLIDSFIKENSFNVSTKKNEKFYLQKSLLKEFIFNLTQELSFQDKEPLLKDEEAERIRIENFIKNPFLNK